MHHVRFSLSFALALAALTACHASSTQPASMPTAPEVILGGEQAPVPLAELTSQKPLTVLLFFASDCPVQKAHDARFRDLVTQYESRGVAFAAVVSEAGGDITADRAEVRRRGFTIPVLEDKGATLADALGVEYSTHVLVLERGRKVVYSGAIDADRTHLTTGGEPYLKDALDAALGGQPITKAKTEALGCPLKKH